MLSQTNGVKTAEARRLLIERIASSRHINRSARLRDLLLYLTARVQDDDVEEIHEQEALLVEIPKGNYAPVFRERRAPEASPFVAEPPLEIIRPAADRRVLVLG